MKAKFFNRLTLPLFFFLLVQCEKKISHEQTERQLREAIKKGDIVVGSPLPPDAGSQKLFNERLEEAINKSEEKQPQTDPNGANLR